MTPLYVATCATVCILASVACWGMSRKYRLHGRRLWPFLGVAAFALLSWELLPSTEARATPPTVEERIRFDAVRIVEENQRLADELRRQIKERVRVRK